MKTPERLVLTTGSEEGGTIEAKRDEFFKQVLAKYGLKPNNPFVCIASKALGIEEPTSFRASDDVIHTLTVRDELVAVVVDRRNDFNNHEVTFLKCTPTRSLQTFLAGLRR